MRRTRLAAAAGVAALTLGATVAAANEPITDDDTQTVTITVDALARTITTDGAATISITAGQDVGDAVVGGDATIAYTNGGVQADIRADITAIGTVGSPNQFTPGSDSLEVAVERSRLFTKFGAATGISIDLRASSVDSAETGQVRTLTPSSADDTGDLQFGDVITNIPTDVSRSAQPVVYSLIGASPVTANEFVVTVTFTILD